MADQVMSTATEYAAAVPELWSSNFYEPLFENLPFNEVVNRDYEGEIKALGDTVNITQFPQFDLADDISEDARVDADAVTAVNLQLIINHQLCKDFIVTERAMRQALNGDMNLRNHAVFAIAKKMQQIMITDTVPSASSPDHQIAYTSGTTLALADVTAASELLDLQDVPQDGKRHMILGAAQYNDLFNILGFTSHDFVPAGSPLSSGSVLSPVVGFQVKMTSEAGNVAYLFHSTYLTAAVQQAPEVKAFDLGVDGKRAMRTNVSMLMGSKQLSNIRVVEIA